MLSSIPKGRMLPAIRALHAPRRYLSSKSTSTTTPQRVAPKAFGIGTVAGTLGALAGMGGGFVMVPLMTGVLRITQHQAHGTSLFAVAATGIAGALGYASGEGDFNDVVQWDSAAAIAACGMLTARLGAYTTVHLTEKFLQQALGVFMIGVAPLIPARAWTLKQAKSTQPADEYDIYTKIVVPGAIGLGSGYLAGLFGVGGGAIVVPALALGTDMNHYQALGTSLCAMILPAVVGTYYHFASNHVQMRIAPALAAGSFVGAYCGGKIGLKTDENVLRWGFASLMVMLGARTLFFRM
uniref:Membrane transporter protein n=1 Tax=Grammatophora oceanica TaxID=210454 RepID=A0A7S1VQG5_9STRA|mmetsp:Transcript_51804/g.77323  ORF Transcript_51804/g.77323 Transcript_51804/m.77323 type:complete len:296 (+) Transcript_51804:114-1001(+)|eukprot:CAMPEP_0194048172 /NCGR_PEP_ID=MMETSP0009_2-20130614/26767_1 /TAXON_ID=210454 /ORGANISM="Grammatophora oceanica, Strain CCMP 410" /LENGTH=295 /DNA_ID=CAMNT_0038693987 /DNA_START=114 /DNA_END=1001 /DNA_ORIENTATION=-